MRILKLIILSFLIGCKTILPIQTETKQGVPIIKTTMQATESRTDIPEGVKPREVVSKIETATGAEAWVVDKHPLNPFNKLEVYKNKKAEEENLVVAQPKAPWWKYPFIGLLVILVCAIVYIIVNIKNLISSIIFWKK